MTVRPLGTALKNNAGPESLGNPGLLRASFRTRVLAIGNVPKELHLMARWQASLPPSVARHSPCPWVALRVDGPLNLPRRV